MKSITYGRVSMRDIVEIIHKKVESSYSTEHNIIIGTDSQNFHDTKIVLVIALHSVGNGGIFFYEIRRVNKIKSLKQKLIKETEISLDCATQLIEEFEKYYEETGFDYTQLGFSIHVDAGYEGPTKLVIPEIVGWVKSCGYDCKVKPYSFAASSIADMLSK